MAQDCFRAKGDTNCPYHPGQTVILRCKDCIGNQLVCSLCILSTHNGHQFVHFKEDINDKIDTIQQYLDRVETLVLPQLQQELLLNTQEISNTASHYHWQIELARKKGKRLKGLIDKLTGKMVLRLKSQMRKKWQALKKHEAAVGLFKSKLEIILKDGKKVIASGSDIMVIDTESEVKLQNDEQIPTCPKLPVKYFKDSTSRPAKYLKKAFGDLTREKTKATSIDPPSVRDAKLAISAHLKPNKRSEAALLTDQGEKVNLSLVLKQQLNLEDEKDSAKKYALPKNPFQTEKITESKKSKDLDCEKYALPKPHAQSGESSEPKKTTDLGFEKPALLNTVSVSAGSEDSKKSRDLDSEKYTLAQSKESENSKPSTNKESDKDAKQQSQEQSNKNTGSKETTDAESGKNILPKFQEQSGDSKQAGQDKAEVKDKTEASGTTDTKPRPKAHRNLLCKPMVLSAFRTPYSIRSICPTSDNKAWIGGQGNNRIQLTNSKGEIQETVTLDIKVWRMCQHPYTGELFCCCQADNSIRHINTANGSTNVIFHTGNLPFSIACTKDNLVVGMSGKICMYNYSGQYVAHRLTNCFTAFNISMNRICNKMALSGGFGGVIVLNDSARPLYTIKKNIQSYCAVFDDEDNLLADDKDNKKIHIFEGFNGKHITWLQQREDDNSNTISLAAHTEGMWVGKNNPSKILRVQYKENYNTKDFVLNIDP